MTPADPFQVEVSYQQARDILLIRTEGVIDRDSMITLFHASAEAAAKYHCHRFFLDHRASPLNLKASEMVQVPDELYRHGVVDHVMAMRPRGRPVRGEDLYMPGCPASGLPVQRDEIFSG